jgi:uncharacterized repeat protein (TIGR04052 family)
MNIKTCISLAAIFAAALAVSQPTLVRAHADLVSAEPAVNSTISTAPKQLRLTFDKKLVAVGTRVALTDAAGVPVRVGKGVLDPNDPKIVTFPVDAGATFADGAYTVRWAALTEDGHTVQKSYSFKFAAAGASAAVPAASTGQPSFRFSLKAGADLVSCGKDIAKLGKTNASAQIVDARMHISNLRLIDAAGKETPVALVPDNRWQSDRVALLDFEDATGLCREGGTKETRNEIVVKAPAGSFVGVAFDVGVPYAINHADVATSKAPLNVAAMWWNWQFGYKFARFDLKTKSTVQRDAFLIHLGSTGCGEMMKKTETTSGDSGHGGAMGAMNKPPSAPCANPNLVSVRLPKFDPAKDVIVADLAGLLSGVDIANPSPQPAGCMSGIDDADCSPLFANFGLSLKTGLCENNCRAQTFFRVEPAGVR